MIKKDLNDNVLYTILKNTIDTHPDGLLIQDGGTGLGKSYCMNQLAIQQLTDHIFPGRKIFIVSSQKKTLNQSENTICKQAGNAGLLYLRNAVESADAFFTSGKNTSIPQKQITDSVEYKSLQDACKCYRSMRSTMTEDFVHEKLSSFGKKINTVLIQEMKRKKNTKKAFSFRQIDDYVRSEPSWQWLKDLCPAIRLRDAEVVLLTNHKFCNSLSTPYGTYGKLSEDSYLTDNSIIFYDESDEIKVTTNNILIEESLNTQIDMRVLFASLRNGIAKDMSAYEKQGGRNSNYDIRKKHLELREQAEELNSRYHMDCPSFKLDASITDDESEVFMFKRVDALHFSRKTSLNLKYLPAEHRMYITKEKEEGSIRFSDYLRDIINFVYDSITLIRNLSYSYRNLKEQSGENFTYTEASSSIMDAMGLHKEIRDFITNNSMMAKTRADEIFDSNSDYSYYEKGFVCCSFRDSLHHAENTKVNLIFFPKTPEKILAHTATSALVICLSATANSRSIIANYNTKWLKDRLGRRYIQISKEEKEALRVWADKQSDYSGVQIKCHVLGCCNSTQNLDLDSCVSKLFVKCDIEHSDRERREYTRYTKEIITDALPAGEDNAFYYDRYLKIAQFYVQCINNHSKSSIMFAPAFLKGDDDPKFSYSLVRKMTDILWRWYRADTTPMPVIVLKMQKTGDEPEYVMNQNELDRMIMSLDKNEPFFVLSSSRSIGRGQNIQHKYKDLDHDLIKVNDREADKADDDSPRKDYEAIGILEPTYILEFPEPYPEKFMQQVLHHALQIEELYENGEISEEQEKLCLESCSGRKDEASKAASAIMRSTDSYFYAKLVSCIQTLGRICRTNEKDPVIHISVDVKMIPLLRLLREDESLFTNEMKALIRWAKGYDQFSSDTENIIKNTDAQFKRKVKVRNTSAYRNIKNWLKRDKNGEFKNIDGWKRIRKTVMKPTISREEYDLLPDMISKYMYAECPPGKPYYTFLQTEDYRYIDNVSFTDNPAQAYMSEHGARLDIILAIPGMKRYFGEMGYDTSFKKDAYAVLLPVAFNNLYKGSLGETAGNYVLTKMMDIQAEEIEDPAKFELFDEVIHGTDTYIDYKNFSEENRIEDGVVLSAALEKAKCCGAKTVVYIQAAVTEEYALTDKTIDGIRFVEIPGFYIIRDGKPETNQKAFEKMREVANGKHKK